MATPLTAAQHLAAVKAAGIVPVLNRGWETRGIWRISAKGWKPEGIIIHQTAGNLGSRSMQQYVDDILNGDPACPDKCNVAVAPSGALWMNAAGRANHCLQYSAKGLAAVKAGKMPLTGKYTDYRGSQENGNYYFYGVECVGTNLNDAQIEMAARWAATLCKAHGWSAGHVAGHGEMADDRDYSDPGIDMGAFRRRVAAILKSGSTGEEDMALSKEDKSFIQAAVKAEIGYAHLQGQADLINNAKTQLHYDIGVVQTQNAALAKRVEELEKKLGGDAK